MGEFAAPYLVRHNLHFAVVAQYIKPEDLVSGGGKVEIAFIRASHNANQILPEEILTEEEARSIAHPADNLMDTHIGY